MKRLITALILILTSGLNSVQAGVVVGGTRIIYPANQSEVQIALKNKDKCSRHSISLEDLTEAVLNAIQVQISLVCNMAEVITEINKQEAVCNQSLRLTKQLQTKEHELEKITNVIDNLYMDWKCGEITRAEYVRMKAKFEAKADSMKNAIVNLKAEIELSSKGVGNVLET